MFRRYFILSYGIALGVFLAFLTSVAIGQALNGTLSVFQPGTVVSSTQINENFRLLREAVQKNGTMIAVTREAPVGSILAWHKDLGPGAPALPAGWLECNGQTVDDAESPFDGATLPDLNGQLRFLRGNSTSGSLQDDAFQGHYHFRNSTGQLESFTVSPGGGLQFVPSPVGGTGVNSQSTGGPIPGLHGHPRISAETRPTNMSVVWIIKIK